MILIMSVDFHIRMFSLQRARLPPGFAKAFEAFGPRLTALENDDNGEVITDIIEEPKQNLFVPYLSYQWETRTAYIVFLSCFILITTL